MCIFLQFNVKMAVKDSIGGWKDNAIVYKKEKGCSTLKYFIGPRWNDFAVKLGLKNKTCPIAPV